ERVVLPLRSGIRPRRERETLGRGNRSFDTALGRDLGEPSPQSLGDERQERVQKTKDMIEREREHLAREIGFLRVRHARLDELDVPVAEVGPEELSQPADRRGRVVRVEEAGRRRDRLRETGEDPTILRAELRERPRPERHALEMPEREPRGVPELVREVTPDVEAI